MVTLNTIKTKLAKNIIGDNIILQDVPIKDANKKIIKGFKITVTLKDFHSLFKDHFSNADDAIAWDEEKGYGYSPYLKKWKKDGLI